MPPLSLGSGAFLQVALSQSLPNDCSNWRLDSSRSGMVSRSLASNQRTSATSTGLGRSSLAVTLDQVPVQEEPAVGDLRRTESADRLNGGAEFLLPLALQGLDLVLAGIDAAAGEAPEIPVGDAGGPARQQHPAISAPDACYANPLQRDAGGRG